MIPFLSTELNFYKSLSNVIKWTQFAQFTGNHSLTLPAEYNELYITATVGSQGSYYTRFTYLFKDMLTDVVTSYYYNGDRGGFIQAKMTKTAISEIKYTDNGQDVSSQTTFTFYYR